MVTIKKNKSISNNMRYDWYETEKYICLTIYIYKKDVNEVKIEHKNNKIILDGEILINQLYDEIISLERKDFKNKIELILKKKIERKWGALKNIPNEKSNFEIASNRQGKDFDCYSNDNNSCEEKGEYTLMQMMEDIYERGTPDQKKAMDKSFYESNFTVLSNQWNDVGNKKVEEISKHVENIEVKPHK